VTVLLTGHDLDREQVVRVARGGERGLPTGLAPVAGTAHAGLTYLSLAAQSLSVEARLLAAPVSFELASTAHAEGIEDRTTMAPLAARRLAEMVELGGTIVAIELAVGAQAVELRGHRPGVGTRRAVAAVRQHVSSLGMGDQVPDVDGLAEAVRKGEISRAAFGDARDAGSRGNGDVDRP
jgi:histidine ammonia-lyase